MEDSFWKLPWVVSVGFFTEETTKKKKKPCNHVKGKHVLDGNIHTQ